MTSPAGRDQSTPIPNGRGQW